MNRCPYCGAHIKSITRGHAGWWILGCGDRLTAEQAAPILAARGDNT